MSSASALQDCSLRSRRVLAEAAVVVGTLAPVHAKCRQRMAGATGCPRYLLTATHRKAKTAGMHRFVWDLQYAPPHGILSVGCLRTNHPSSGPGTSGPTRRLPPDRRKAELLIVKSCISSIVRHRYIAVTERRFEQQGALLRLLFSPRC
jgi:hypothetical protein